MNKSSKRIYLHIGHPKCGSSTLQELFRLHRKDLRASGIIYPFVGDGELRITSGNLTGIITLLGIQKRIVEAIKEYPNSNLLFSTEHLTRMFLQKSNLIETQEVFKSFGYELHVIMITRDALEYGVSSYFQRSKRDRVSATLSTFESNAMRILRRGCLLIENFKEASVPYVIFNLKSSKPIEYFVFNSMGVEVKSFTKLPRLNRAPSKSEFVLLQAFAFVDKEAKVHLSNQLSVGNPELDSMKLSFSSEEKQILGNTLNPMIKHFNSLAPKHAHLNLIAKETGSGSSNRAVSLMELNQLILNVDSTQILESWIRERYVPKNEIKKHFLASLKRKIRRRLRI